VNSCSLPASRQHWALCRRRFPFMYNRLLLWVKWCAVRSVWTDSSARGVVLQLPRPSGTVAELWCRCQQSRSERRDSVTFGRYWFDDNRCHAADQRWRQCQRCCAGQSLNNTFYCVQSSVPSVLSFLKWIFVSSFAVVHSLTSLSFTGCGQIKYPNTKTAMYQKCMDIFVPYIASLLSTLLSTSAEFHVYLAASPETKISQLFYTKSLTVIHS